VNMTELQCSIVVANLPDLRVPHFLSNVISTAAHATKSRLIIVLFSPFFNGSNASATMLPGTSHTNKWHETQCILTFAYVQASKVAQDMGNPLMDVDVLLKGTEDDLSGDWGSDADRLYCVQGGRSLIVQN
jgi:pantetheine-phosphate adenylyltransferase